MLLKDSNEFMKLLRHVENAARSPIFSERHIAFECLICISTKLKGNTVMMPEFDLAKFSSGVAAVVIDQITMLVSLLSGGTPSFEVEKELQSMLRMLLVLVQYHSELRYFALDKLHLLIENYVNSHDASAAGIQAFEVHKVVDAGTSEQTYGIRVFMFCIYRFLVAFFENFNETDASSEQVVCKLKHLISFVCGNGLFDCAIHTFYSLIWHSHANWSCLSSENQNFSRYGEGLSSAPCKLHECETVILKCAENMLDGRDNWCAYRAGKYAACKGAWDMANFIFHRLEKRVQSDFCCQWFRFLVHFTNAEKIVKVQTCFASPSDHLMKPSALDNRHWTIVSSECIEKLIVACDGISCSDKVLKAISLQKQSLYFQRWFLSLRQKMLLILVDVLELLCRYLFFKSSSEVNGLPRESDIDDGSLQFLHNRDIISSLAGVSSRMASLAEEFDLVTASFIDMDSRSLKVMADLTLGCLVLAFCTEFMNSIALRYLTKSTGDSHCVIVKDLIKRMWHTDSEIFMELLSLSEDTGMHEKSLGLLHRFQTPKVSCISHNVLTFCRSCVQRMIRLQEQSRRVQNEDTALQVYKDGMLSLLSIVEAWMHLPFRIPMYFFRV